MSTEKLYDRGWRQGSVLELSLEAVAYSHDAASGSPRVKKEVHDMWTVVTQDCSLARARVDNNSPAIELRQVLHEKPPDNWGIHARKFLLSDEAGHYLQDDRPSAFVSAKVLGQLPASARLYTLEDGRVLGLKTWLGNRYDRPAVPEHLVPLAKAIAESIETTERSKIGRTVRDVYMDLDGLEGTLTYSLFAVVTPEADPEAVREWLTEAALSVSSDLGSLIRVEALPTNKVSLSLLENTFCADLSLITWGEEPAPDGAY